MAPEEHPSLLPLFTSSSASFHLLRLPSPTCQSTSTPHLQPAFPVSALKPTLHSAQPFFNPRSAPSATLSAHKNSKCMTIGSKRTSRVGGVARLSFSQDQPETVVRLGCSEDQIHNTALWVWREYAGEYNLQVISNL